MNKKNSTARNTMIVMLGTFLSRFLGFFRIALISSIFGSTWQTDVLNLVFTIPNNLRKLLAEGALSSAFIPVLSSCIQKKDDSDKVLIRILFTFIIIVNLIFIGLSIFFSKEITLIFLHFKNQKSRELSNTLFKIMITYIIFVSVSSIFIGLLNSKKKFISTSLAPLLFSISVIFSISFLSKQLGIYSMAIGVLFGGLIQTFVLYVSVKKINYSLKLSFKFKNKNFKKVLKMWFPLIGTSSIMILNQTIAVMIASSLKEGSGTAFSNAIVFFQLPLGLFANSVVSVFFPYLSKYFSQKDRNSYILSVSNGMSLLFLFLIPSSIFMFLFSKELISVALFRNHFTKENVYLTASTLSYYSLGLFFAASFNFFSRIFYSIKNSTIPFFISIIFLLIDVPASLYLKESFGIIGLALASTLTYILCFSIFLTAYIKKFNTLDFKIFYLNALKTLLASCPMILSYYFLRHYKLLNWWEFTSSFKTLFLFFTMTGSFLIFFLLIGKLLNNEILNWFLNSFLKKNK